MRPITHDELKEHARELPPANRARGERHYMMRRPSYAQPYYVDRPYDHMSMAYDKLEFRAHRGHLDGSMVWYWTHRDVIVRVDV
ncbi:hypothetical protein HFN51_04265 [Rhizobium leguminosarum]|nr:hypothetical protein [Rhizobium leguminosarum]